jgi:hypothetical protein
MAYSECLPTRLNPLAESARFSQALEMLDLSEGFGFGCATIAAMNRATYL